MLSEESRCLTILQTDMNYIKDKINHIENKLDKKYVTHQEFEPVKLIAFGLVGFTLLSVLGAIIYVTLGI